MKPTGELLDQILSQAPSSETLFLLLKRWKAEGEVDKVIRECIRGLSRFPRDIRIRGLLAEVCFESGWLSRAESEVETATAQIEALVPLYKLRAQIYSILNRREEAAKCLEIYLVHRPDDKESLALMQALRSKPEAPPDTLQPPSSAPEIATPTLAEVYFAQGQFREAISTYEKFLAQNPNAEQSQKRLEELKAMMAPPPAQEEPDAERERKKKMKLIHVLEAWKESITKPHTTPS